MQKKTIDELISAQQKTEEQLTDYKFLEFFEPWLPWLDGEIIKGQLLELDKWLDNNKFPLKPLVIGSLTEESVLNIYGAYDEPVTGEDYFAVIMMAFKEVALSIFEEYPIFWNNTDQRDQISALATRWIFSCSSRKFLETYISHPRSDQNGYYMYVFDFPLDFDGWAGDQKYCKNRVCHGADLPYTFDVPDANFTSSGHKIAVEHINYWSNYAKYQTPNEKSNKQLYWPQYDLKERNYLRFKAPENLIEVSFLQQECDFLDPFGYYIFD